MCILSFGNGLTDDEGTVGGGALLGNGLTDDEGI